MNQTIMATVREFCNLTPTDDSFDVELKIHSTSAIFELEQLGVQIPQSFMLDSTKLWSDYLGDRTDLEAVKSYICMYTRLLFDPPANSFLVNSIQSNLDRLAWRIREHNEPTEPEEEPIYD